MPFKYNIHIFGMFESAEGCNAFCGKLGGRQQLFDSFDLHVADFFLWSSPEMLSNFPFKRTARYSRLLNNILHRNPAARILSNILQRGNDSSVIDRNNIGRLSDSDSERWNGGLDLHAPVSGHQRREDFRSSKTDPFCVDNNTRESWFAHATKKIVIVDTQDRHMLRDSDVFTDACRQNGLAASIVAGEDAAWPFQGSKPGSQIILLFVPSPCRGVKPRDMMRRGIKTLLAKPLAKSDQSPFRPSFIAITAECKVSKSAFEQVLRGKPPDLQIVRSNQWKTGVRIAIRQLHGRYLRPANNLEQTRCRHTRNNPIPSPILQPSRRFGRQVSLLQKDRPFIVHPHKTDNPRQQPAPIRTRRLDQ